MTHKEKMANAQITRLLCISYTEMYRQCIITSNPQVTTVIGDGIFITKQSKISYDCVT